MKYCKSILYVVLFFGLFSLQLYATEGDGSLSDTNIQYIGRWDKSNKNVFHSYWGGAYFKVTFTGTSVKIKLLNEANIYVNIDGQGDVKYSKAKGILDLTANILSKGKHTLRVTANYSNDEISFQGLILDKGARTIAQPKKDIIEFIGNSITSGQKTTKGNLSSYAWLTGEYLFVDHTQISQPGITLVDGYRYDANWAPKRGQSAQYFLMKEPNNDVNPLWDFKSYTPKIVVVNLGTNDHNLKVPNEIFQNTYALFLQEIRNRYPEAEIVVMRTLAGHYAQETKNAVNTVINAGDEKVHYIDTEGWLSLPEDYSDGVHPNDSGHLKITAQLSEVLKTIVVR